MTRFNLVRLPNNDFVLSAGSRIPVDALVAGADTPAFSSFHGYQPMIADLLIEASHGITVEAA